jgi:glycosyltransferase involved in cell wall biosynthesis
VVLEHGTNIPDLYKRSSRALQVFMNATLRRVARCIVLAECLKFNFESFLPSERIVSAYLGIDSNGEPDTFVEPTRAGEAVTLLFVSTLLESKGILVLLRALAKVLSTCKDVRVVVAGGWGWDSSKVRAEVDDFLSRKNHAESVSFIGPVQGKEKLRVFQEADFFVLPTLVDTAPLVLLEAMRAGLPIVATNVGAIPEILGDGINGFICERGNPLSLAEKILHLIEHPDLREQMSRNGLERFKKLFTSEKFAGRMIDVFESVFAERSPRTHVAAIET